MGRTVRYKNIHGQDIEFVIAEIDRTFEKELLEKIGLDTFPQECYLPPYSGELLPDLLPYEGLWWAITLSGTLCEVNAAIVGRTWVMPLGDTAHWVYSIKVRIQ